MEHSGMEHSEQDQWRSGARLLFFCASCSVVPDHVLGCDGGSPHPLTAKALVSSLQVWSTMSRVSRAGS
eukprot:1161263-Pelagomonas_calceolata.AAC.25